MNNALKRRSAQFHKNKKPRFVNTQTSPTCLSRKRKNKRNVQAVPSRLACHRGWPQRQKAMKMSAVPSHSGAAAKCQSQEFHPLVFKFKRVLVFPTPTRLQYQILSLKIGYSGPLVSFQLLYLWCLDLLKWKPALVSLDCPLLILLMGRPGGQSRGFQRSTMQSFTGQKRPPPPSTKILGLCQQEEDSSRNCQMNVLTNKIRPPLRPRGRERWVLLAVTSTQIRSCPSGA